MSRKRKAGLGAICGQGLRKTEAGRVPELLAADLAAARRVQTDGSSKPVARGRRGVGTPGPALPVSSRAARSNGQRRWPAAQQTVMGWRRPDGPQLQESLRHGSPEGELRLAGPRRESPR